MWCFCSTVSRAIAQSEGYQGDELESRLDALKQAVFDTLDSAAKIEAVVARYCRRRIDRLLKKLDLSDAKDVTRIGEVYQQRTSELNIADIAQEATCRIRQALQNQELSQLLANYDNRELLALAARHLKNQKAE